MAASLLLPSIIFCVGYALIIFEAATRINKSAIALLTGVFCWAAVFFLPPDGQVNAAFLHHFSSLGQLIFFLLSAMAIVEIMNVHGSFQYVSRLLKVTSKQKLLWICSFLTFFLSAVLDNLTTTIVILALIKRLVSERHDRLLLGGAVVIAANAGGCWTPIGDVTTTMLWIGGQITTIPIMVYLFIPSMVCMLVSVAWIAPSLTGRVDSSKLETPKTEPHSQLIFFLGVFLLIFVPAFKQITGLPPFMGMIFGLGVLWLVTDFLHSPHASRQYLRVPAIFAKIDLACPYFFLGILLAVSALDESGTLSALAGQLKKIMPNDAVLNFFIGILSAIVDNVPLVAACMGMYPLTSYPVDDTFWQMLAYCAGTGGSILIIGSAAGVAFMAIEEVHFGWYLKRFAPAAFAGYLAGFFSYLITVWVVG